LEIAREKGYWVRRDSDFIEFNRWHWKFGKRIVDRVDVVIKKNGKNGCKFTVRTIIDHPKQGKTQLVRENVSYELLRKIFSYPRIHTGKGRHWN
jgi:hypothetical protein